MPKPRTPTALKLLKGTLQPCRTNRNEPDLPAVDVLPCPEHLVATHARWWEFLVSHAAKLRCLTEADVPALVEMVGVKVEIEKMAKTKNSTVKSRKVLFEMLGKFGMTPSDRSKVSAAPAEAVDRLAKFKTYPGKK
jgi:phage terminase small subunit